MEILTFRLTSDQWSTLTTTIEMLLEETARGKPHCECGNGYRVHPKWRRTLARTWRRMDRQANDQG